MPCGMPATILLDIVAILVNSDLPWACKVTALLLHQKIFLLLRVSFSEAWYMLTIMDNEEFFEQERPISLSDIRLLVIILKQASWHVFWVVPATMSSLKLGTDFFANKFSVETI
ncbi:E3 ubiquitin-protein ligase UPL6 [Dendrobium catenatum]|uniref:E3 ubiquitin-protein ligase UPL6 n=1 Tax=Dendrobium catenatum TaxID=906689 RepID=A0A2I0VVR4_9ASPA|nr:E3 ubiquitin-protein ligase UPL6 [Dendrobium catenatum]